MLITRCNTKFIRTLNTGGKFNVIPRLHTNVLISNAHIFLLHEYLADKKPCSCHVEGFLKVMEMNLRNCPPHCQIIKKMIKSDVLKWNSCVYIFTLLYHHTQIFLQCLHPLQLFQSSNA